MSDDQTTIFCRPEYESRVRIEYPEARIVTSATMPLDTIYVVDEEETADSMIEQLLGGSWVRSGDLNLWLPAINVRLEKAGDGLYVAQSSPDESLWRRDETEGYPKYYPVAEQKGQAEPVEHAYIQPGGCVEISIHDNEEEWMWHICDFPQVVAMMNDLLRAWQDHPERY